MRVCGRIKSSDARHWCSHVMVTSQRMTSEETTAVGGVC